MQKPEPPLFKTPAKQPGNSTKQKHLHPHAAFLYGISIDTSKLIDKLSVYYQERNATLEPVVNMDKLQNALAPLCTDIENNLGISLQLNWCICDLPLSHKTAGRADVSFITTQYHSTSGKGYSYINMGNYVEIDPLEEQALQVFCKILHITLPAEATLGFCLVSGLLNVNQ